MIQEEIEIPDGVEASIEENKIRIVGPKGRLELSLRDRSISIKKEGKAILVSSQLTRRKNKAMIGTIAGHIRNMIKGVNQGFTYHLQIFFAHFPINVSVQGKKVLIKNFLGEKFPREATIVGDTKVDVKGLDIFVSGINIEDVGQTATNIVNTTKIGRRDPRVFQDGIFILKKED